MREKQQIDDWFQREVLPLEPSLMRFLRRNWHNESDLTDLRQELYVRLYESALVAVPAHTRAFVFTAARNMLINHVRRGRIVSMEVVADLDALNIAIDTITPEQQISSREELHRLQTGLDRLPPRCREVVLLRRVEGLSQREVATKLGVGEDTVEKHMMYGMRALIDFMLGGLGRVQRKPVGAGKTRQRLDL
ncbi:RNA polymerase sigma factor [Pseudomonas sp.]|uniref:RNA polymerase sigma factor n=1 Tax=Pseudomonas sp. TaxID=306 RepID=UPI003340009C